MTSFLHESVVLYAKDLFGIFLRNARIRFYQQETLVYEDRFRGGIVAVRVPENLTPGVYDIETIREGDTGGNISTYTVRDFVIPLSSHYFDHSQLHGDIKLEGGNFDPETVIEPRKLDPLLYYYLRKIPANLQEDLHQIIQSSGNPDSIRWGGGVSLDEVLEVSKGEAVVGGILHTWDNTSFDLPPDLGEYEIGLNDGLLTLGREVDFPFARVLREGYDWIRLEVERSYHPIKRGSDHFFFEGYEITSSDVTTSIPSEEILQGGIYTNEVYGLTLKPGENTSVELDFHGQGPVIFTDRLYVYATLEYFLLFENHYLLTALPRFEDPHIILKWDLEGLVFNSYGSDGHIRYEMIRPYLPSWVALMTGPFTREETFELRHVISAEEIISGDEPSSWTSTEASETAVVLINDELATF